MKKRRTIKYMKLIFFLVKTRYLSSVLAVQCPSIFKNKCASTRFDDIKDLFGNKKIQSPRLVLNLNPKTTTSGWRQPDSRMILLWKVKGSPEISTQNPSSQPQPSESTTTNSDFGANKTNISSKSILWPLNATRQTTVEMPNKFLQFRAIAA